MKRFLSFSLIFLLVVGITTQVIAGGSGFRIEKGARIAGGISSNTIRLNDGTIRMYYTGEGIMVADSSDGLNFENKRQVLTLAEVQAVFPEITQIANSAIIKLADGTFRMIFEGQIGGVPRFYSATSADGLTNWTVETGVRLEDTVDGSVFSSVPDIIRLDDDRLRMYYVSGPDTRTAISSDEGLTWTKEGAIKLNKKMSEVVDPDITKVGKKYVLLFSNEPHDKSKKGVGAKANTLKKIYRAYSKNGRSFKYAGLIIKLKKSDAVDPDMVKMKPRRGKSLKYRIYFSRMKDQDNDILSALYK